MAERAAQPAVRRRTRRRSSSTCPPKRRNSPSPVQESRFPTRIPRRRAGVYHTARSPTSTAADRPADCSGQRRTPAARRRETGRVQQKRRLDLPTRAWPQRARDHQLRGLVVDECLGERSARALPRETLRRRSPWCPNPSTAAPGRFFCAVRGAHPLNAHSARPASAGCGHRVVLETRQIRVA